MKSTPPFFKQERPETCMLACLRMLLAYRGIAVSEGELAGATSEAGFNPDQVVELARRHDLEAEAKVLTVGDIGELVAKRLFPIVLIDRWPLDGDFAIHAVIPIRLSKRSITVLDPLRGRRRIPLSKFKVAHERVGNWSVTWNA